MCRRNVNVNVSVSTRSCSFHWLDTTHRHPASAGRGVYPSSSSRSSRPAGGGRFARCQLSRARQQGRKRDRMPAHPGDVAQARPGHINGHFDTVAQHVELRAFDLRPRHRHLHHRQLQLPRQVHQLHIERPPVQVLQTRAAAHERVSAQPAAPLSTSTGTQGCSQAARQPDSQTEVYRLHVHVPDC